MSTDEPIERRRRRGDRGLFGMVLLFAGIVWFLSRAGMLHVAADTLLSALLMCIGAGLLITRRSGRRIWPILLGGVVLFVLMGSSASARVHWSGPGTSTDYRPTSVDQLRNPYQIGAGNMQLDLTRLAFTGTAHIRAKMGAGRLLVTVPPDVGVQVHYQDFVGDVTLEGHDIAGLGSNGTWASPGYSSGTHRIDLDLEVGAGQIVVQSGSSPSPGPSVPAAPSAPTTPGSPT